MAEKPLDRRVQRTREILGTALRELSDERGYDSITIQNIIDRANVGRATFYAHFRHKDDLLLHNFQHFLDVIGRKMESAVTAGISDGDRQLIPSLAMFRQVDGNFDRHKAALESQGSTLIKSRLHGFLVEHLQAQIEIMIEGRQPSEVPLPILCNHLVSALLNLVWWWVEHDRPFSPEEMDVFLQKMTKPTLVHALGVDT